MGPSFSVHDNFVTESMGPIYDRSQERLGYSDQAVGAARRLMLAALADMGAGKEPLGRHHDAQSALLKDLVVRSYVVDDHNNYKESVLAPAQLAG
jgi:phthalate 4,5-dioxygenase oxygenase subunit